MVNGAADQAEFDRLGALAAFSFATSSKLLPTLQRDRPSQRQLVESLAASLSTKTDEFRVSREFLIHTIGLKDTSLLESWTGSARNLAWLMVHEGLSEYFARYAIRRWNPEVFIVHHVPKTAGTSVNNLLHSQGLFVAYPQGGFKDMCKTYGMLGFAKQASLFQKRFDSKKLYIGGHYNLPNRVASIGLMGKCKGVCLCRDPLDLLSSAVRFVWTKIESGDEEVRMLYEVADLDPSQLALLRKAAESAPGYSQRFADVVKRIMGNKQFRSEYEEIYVKYFYANEINTPAALRTFLRECGDLFFSFDASANQRQILSALHVEGTLPHVNRSVLSEKAFFGALGGVDAFRLIVAPWVKKSVRIYKMLLEMSKTAPNAEVVTP